MQIYLGQPGWLPAARGLFENFWPRRNFYPLREEFYRWQYQENPFLPEDMAEGCACAAVNGQLVGYIGLVPVPFHVADEVVTGVYLTNWLVHPDYRSRGVGLHLIRNIMARFPLIAGTAVSGQAAGIYRALGARYLNDIPRWIGIFDAEQASELCMAEDERLKRSILGRRTIRLPYADECDYELLEGPCSENMDELWSRLVARMGVASTRNAAYVNWRYFNHPAFRYRMVVIRNGGKWEGVAVFRVERVQDRSAGIMRIVEFLAEEDVQLALASAIVREARKRNCVLADFHGLTETWVSGLVGVGFFQHQEEPDLVVPFLFQPLDHRRRQNFIAWSNLRTAAGLPITANLHKWYVSRGDCDQDRPN